MQRVKHMLCVLSGCLPVASERNRHCGATSSQPEELSLGGVLGKEGGEERCKLLQCGPGELAPATKSFGAF